MSDFTHARATLIMRILEGDGTTSRAQRRGAFENDRLDGPADALINKVVDHACRVTEQDMAATKEAGLSEDQIFEMVVCAAIGQAHRQYEKALAALKTAKEEGR